MWLNEYDSVEWSDSLECYVCQFEAAGSDTALNTAQTEAQGDAGCIQCEDLGWPMAAPTPPQEAFQGCLELAGVRFGPGAPKMESRGQGPLEYDHRSECSMT